MKDQLCAIFLVFLASMVAFLVSWRAFPKFCCLKKVTKQTFLFCCGNFKPGSLLPSFAPTNNSFHIYIEKSGIELFCSTLITEYCN